MGANLSESTDFEKLTRRLSLYFPRSGLIRPIFTYFERNEFTGFGEDRDETAGKASERRRVWSFGKATAEHLQNVLSGLQ